MIGITRKTTEAVNTYLFLTKGIYKQVSSTHGLLTDATGDAYYIHKSGRMGAFSGDLVEARVTKPKTKEKKAEAAITKILSRSKNDIAGTFVKRKGQDFGFVRAYNTFDGKDIYVFKQDSKDAQNNDVVIVRIRKGLEKPVGEVVKILGKKDAPGVREQVAILESSVRTEFAEKVVNEALKLKGRGILTKRTDLSAESIFTIDGADAKDLDDAIHVKKGPGGDFELGIHIADVCEFVKEGSAIDHEARIRGTSIYLPGRVIPMLPKELSDDLCSLHPGGPKATLSAIMTIDGKTGEVLGFRIKETLIRSKARLVYEDVSAFIEGEGDSGTQDAGVNASLFLAQELAELLHVRRKKEGKIEFEFPEVKVEVDKDYRPVRIYRRERNIAQRMIEEFMILANEEVSRFFGKRKIPFLFRVHEKPQEDSMLGLIGIFARFGLTIDPSQVTPLSVSKLMGSIQGKPDEYLISKQILLAMSKARYDTVALGHFGLALQYYSHFTSPIRRYPDLQIHRIIKDLLNNRLTKEKLSDYGNMLPQVAEKCSARERTAEELENKIRDMKCIEYMSSRIGTEYSGRVSGINAFGMYVELENGIEGFVLSRTLEESFEFIDEKSRFVSKSLGLSFGIGDAVRIKVAKADPDLGYLDFGLLI